MSCVFEERRCTNVSEQLKTGSWRIDEMKVSLSVEVAGAGPLCSYFFLVTRISLRHGIASIFVVC